MVQTLLFVKNQRVTYWIFTQECNLRFTAYSTPCQTSHRPALHFQKIIYTLIFMKIRRTLTPILILCVLVGRTSGKSVAYIHGDISENGTMPSGTAPAYDQMLLSDSGNTGCSQFKNMVEDQGYTISQHYDQTTSLDASFLNAFDVIIFGLHQKIWSENEKNALHEWILSGGGILMYSDSAAGGKYNVVGIRNPTGQSAVNNILSRYGMQVTVDQGGGIRAYTSPAHSPNPIVWDQPVFEGEGVSPVAIDPAGNAEALIPLNNAHRISGSDLSIDARNVTISNPEWAVMGHTAVGKGHVIAIFDRQPVWNNGPGSDINEEDNKEILRRIVRYLARDYGNSSDWINLTSTSKSELTYRQWSGGTGTPGLDYIARNTSFTALQNTNLIENSWLMDSNAFEFVGTQSESTETEIATLRLLPNIGTPSAFYRIAISPATNSPPSNLVRAINCGGGTFSSTSGIIYEADTLFSGGGVDAFSGNAVANTDDDPLYNTARSKSGFAGYNIPVTNGNYTVMLQFAETYWTAANKRIFSVSIEGIPVIQNLDLFATAPGKWVAYNRTFPVAVSDGMLSISFSASANNPLINAIVIQSNQE
ncbi:malectin [Pontiellaceae bacterium B12219]|nr:malectin [Pontiellaceae bacterium B12219]